MAETFVLGGDWGLGFLALSPDTFFIEWGAQPGLAVEVTDAPRFRIFSSGDKIEIEIVTMMGLKTPACDPRALSDVPVAGSWIGDTSNFIRPAVVNRHRSELEHYLGLAPLRTQGGPVWIWISTDTVVGISWRGRRFVCRPDGNRWDVGAREFRELVRRYAPAESWGAYRFPDDDRWSSRFLLFPPEEANDEELDAYWKTATPRLAEELSREDRKDVG